MMRICVFSYAVLLSTLGSGCDDGKAEEEPPVPAAENADAAPQETPKLEGVVEGEPEESPAPKSEAPTEQEVGAMLKAISTPNWSKEGMLKKVHPRVLADGGEAAVSVMMDAYAEALGPVQSISTPPITLKVGQAKDAAGSDVRVVVYKAEAVFAKSKGEINAQLMLDDGKWRIVLLSVESAELEVFMKKSAESVGN